MKFNIEFWVKSGLILLNVLGFSSLAATVLSISTEWIMLGAFLLCLMPVGIGQLALFVFGFMYNRVQMEEILPIYLAIDLVIVFALIIRVQAQKKGIFFN